MASYPLTEAALALLEETRKQLHIYERLLVAADQDDVATYEAHQAIAEAVVAGSRAVNELGASLREAARLLTG